MCIRRYNVRKRGVLPSSMPRGGRSPAFTVVYLPKTSSQESGIPSRMRRGTIRLRTRTELTPPRVTLLGMDGARR